MSILNHDKYTSKSCSDFSNLSAALMKVHFWQDEFIETDSDLVLTLQDDAVLCLRNTKNNAADDDDD